MKTLAGILFLLLHMSCTLLIPQIAMLSERDQSVSALYAMNAPEDNHNMPLDQFPGEDQEQESAAGSEESGHYIYHAHSIWDVEPIYLQSHDIRYFLDCQRFLSQSGDVLAPPPKA